MRGEERKAIKEGAKRGMDAGRKIEGRKDEERRKEEGGGGRVV